MHRLPCITLVDSRRRLPARPGQHLSRRGAVRLDLRPPGAGCRREGIAQIAVVHGCVHRGRRLHPGAVRRVGDRARPGFHVPGRPAADAGRHRRGRRRRDAGRRADAQRRQRRDRPPGRATTRMRWPSPAAWSRGWPTGRRRRWQLTEPRRRACRSSEIYRHISRDARHPSDNREILLRLVDDSRFEEFKPLYGETLMCGFARINGFPVGILANRGVLLHRERAEGRALHRPVLPARHAAAVPRRRHRLHGRPRRPSRAASPRPAPR